MQIVPLLPPVPASQVMYGSRGELAQAICRAPAIDAIEQRGGEVRTPCPRIRCDQRVRRCLDQERIAGKEEPDEQPRLREDDGREADVPTPLDECLDVREAVEQIDDGIHYRLSDGGSKLRKQPDE